MTVEVSDRESDRNLLLQDDPGDDADQPDQGGVGQLVPERPGLPALRAAHGTRLTTIVPEIRP